MTDTEDDWEDDEEVAAIVIDNGSGAIKAGFAGDDSPKVIFPSIVGRPKIKDSIFAVTHKAAYIGDEIMQNNDLELRIRYPIQHGVVTSWDDMEYIWHHTFYNKLRIQPEEYAVMMTEAPLTPKANREKTLQIMFETFNAPAVYNGIQAVLSLYCAGRVTGIVLDSGFDSTHSVPIYEGYALPHAIVAGNHQFNGNDITQWLMRWYGDRDYNLSMEIANDIKETLCFIAPHCNYKSNQNTQYQLPDGKTITVGSERFECTEALFQTKETNIQSMLCESILQCDTDIRDDLYKNIILCGGNTMFNGMQSRLKHEMRRSLHIHAKTDGFVRNHFATMLPTDVMNIIYRNCDHFKIISNSSGHSVWLGGSILASLNTFQEMWVSKDEYDESGPGIVHRKIF